MQNQTADRAPSEKPAAKRAVVSPLADAPTSASEVNGIDYKTASEGATGGKCSNSTRHYRMCKKRIMEDLGGKCRKCGTTKNLDIHHKIKTLPREERNSSWRRLSDWKHNMEKLELLCRKCHIEEQCKEHIPIFKQNVERFRCKNCGHFISFDDIPEKLLKSFSSKPTDSGNAKNHLPDGGGEK